jgi:acetyl/propionyl-CoA carboxylase alpha subunit
VSHPIALRLGEASIEATLEIHGTRARLSRGGRSLEVEARREGPWIEIRSGERSVRCAVASEGHGIWVGFAGRSYRFEIPRGDARGADGEENDGDIRAPMTGRIAAVAAAPGASVREGDSLVTVEAMKMEFRLVAPRDGTVESVSCAAGDRVELGQILVSLAPIAPAREGSAAAESADAEGPA